MAKLRKGSTHGFPTISISRLALCEANCKKPVYTMHKWWARRLGVIFRMLLLGEASGDDLTRAERWSRFYSSHRLPKGFTVLDPFLGGGTSLIEAAKLGANCIGYDIDPVACFVSKMELQATAPDRIKAGFREIETAVAETIKGHYRSFVDRKSVDVIYFFWVDSILCPNCEHRFDGHPTFQLSHDVNTGTQVVVCPECDALHDIALDRKVLICRECSTRTRLHDAPVSYGTCTCPSCEEAFPLYWLYKEGHVEPRLFAKEYLTSEGQRGFAPTTKRDLLVFDKAEAEYDANLESLPIPDALIPSRGRSDSRPLLYGYTRYDELFNSRQLYCLGLIAAEIQKIDDRDIRRTLALAFSHCLASNNMFCGYAFGYRRLTPLFSVHSYRKISRPVEGNVWGLSLGRGTFANCVRAVIEGNRYMREPYELKYGLGRPERVDIKSALISSESDGSNALHVEINNQSSTKMQQISDESVDVILSDPPYFDNLPYSELADFYHVWLRELLGTDYKGHKQRHTPMQTMLYAGRRTGDKCDKQIHDTYTETVKGVFSECFRVAKPDARFIFTYHHKLADAWNCLGEALLTSGFRVTDVFPVRSEGRSGLHNYKGSLKWDSIFICEKTGHAALEQPSDRRLETLIHDSASNASNWRNRITTASLDFNDVDRRSLAMSFVLCEFSRRLWDSTRLKTALDNLATEFDSPRRRIRSLSSGR